MKNTKAEPSIVPSSGINSPIIKVVIIGYAIFDGKVTKKIQTAMQFGSFFTNIPYRTWHPVQSG